MHPCGLCLRFALYTYTIRGVQLYASFIQIYGSCCKCLRVAVYRFRLFAMLVSPFLYMTVMVFAIGSKPLRLKLYWLTPCDLARGQFAGAYNPSPSSRLPDPDHPSPAALFLPPPSRVYYSAFLQLLGALSLTRQKALTRAL